MVVVVALVSVVLAKLVVVVMLVVGGAEESGVSGRSWPTVAQVEGGVVVCSVVVVLHYTTGLPLHYRSLHYTCSSGATM